MSSLADHFSTISPSLGGSSCPGLSGSSLLSDLDYLHSRGVVALISLNEATLDWRNPLPHGIAHLVSPVSDYRAPTLAQMEEIRDFWRSWKDQGTGIVCVHCNAGMGRTGTVLACLLLDEHQGAMKAEEAIKVLREKRRGSIQTFKQEDFVKEWFVHLEKQRSRR